jgi:hypothetical protein
MTNNLRKKQLKKLSLFDQNCNLLIPRPFKLQGKPSTIKTEHPTLKKMKFIDFFLFLRAIFALLDPDPRIPLNPDPQHGFT